MIRRVIFEPKAKEEYDYWKKENIKNVEKIRGLVQNIKKTTFHGLGKPEPLKYGLSGYWSRRIDKLHRLIYRVTDEAIVVISCRHHYDE